MTMQLAVDDGPNMTVASAGACQDPGKIWKGKKMAGQMGNKLRTVLSAWVYKVCLSRSKMIEDLIKRRPEHYQPGNLHPAQA